jgi:hypothetical protein
MRMVKVRILPPQPIFPLQKHPYQWRRLRPLLSRLRKVTRTDRDCVRELKKEKGARTIVFVIPAGSDSKFAERCGEFCLGLAIQFTHRLPCYPHARRRARKPA